MKRKIYCVALVCSLLLVGCGSENIETKENRIESTEKVTDAVESETEAVEVSTEEVVEEVRYADDDIVNQFIIDFSDSAGYELKDIQKGNIKTKYFCYANDIYVELLNATDNVAGTFNISYSFSSQTPEFRDLTDDEKYELLTECLQTLGATDEEIVKTIDDLTVNNEGDYMIEGYEVNSSITVTYCPTKELSSGKSIGHIEIASSTYGK